MVELPATFAGGTWPKQAIIVQNTCCKARGCLRKHANRGSACKSGHTHTQHTALGTVHGTQHSAQHTSHSSRPCTQLPPEICPQRPSRARAHSYILSRIPSSTLTTTHMHAHSCTPCSIQARTRMHTPSCTLCSTHRHASTNAHICPRTAAYLAVHSLLLRAQLVKLCGKPDIIVLDGRQLGLLHAARLAQLVLVLAQANMHAALTCA